MFATPASLLDRLRQPEQATAWDRFVELYTPLLFHWAQRLGQQDSDCADLVQDVLQRAELRLRRHAERLGFHLVPSTNN